MQRVKDGCRVMMVGLSYQTQTERPGYQELQEVLLYPALLQFNEEAKIQQYNRALILQETIIYVPRNCSL